MMNRDCQGIIGQFFSQNERQGDCMTDRLWLWISRGLLGLASQMVALAQVTDLIPPQAKQEITLGIKQIYDAIEKK
jgi:hypothetical protein